MTPSDKKITRTNVMSLIKKFANEYRKAFGKAPAEIIIVGGGSIMLNYKFREATQDLDVILKAASGIKDVIARFADANNLPRDWMNTDFMKTESYSDALSEVSKHFCTLNNGTLEIRTVSGVYLIAMKLRARREYRNDMSDAVGVLLEEREAGTEVSFADIDDAFMRLYKKKVPENVAEVMRKFCEMDCADLRAYYTKQKESENEIGQLVIDYMDKGANINSRNVAEVVARIKEKRGETLDIR